MLHSLSCQAFIIIISFTGDPTFCAEAVARESHQRSGGFCLFWNYESHDPTSLPSWHMKYSNSLYSLQVATLVALALDHLNMTELPEPIMGSGNHESCENVTNHSKNVRKIPPCSEDPWPLTQKWSQDTKVVPRDHYPCDKWDSRSPINRRLWHCSSGLSDTSKWQISYISLQIWSRQFVFRCCNRWSTVG